MVLVGVLVVFAAIVGYFFYLSRYPERHPWWLKSNDEWVRSWATLSTRDYPILHHDEMYRRRQFAHQWKYHPILSQREAKKRKEALRQNKRNIDD